MRTRDAMILVVTLIKMANFCPLQFDSRKWPTSVLCNCTIMERWQVTKLKKTIHWVLTKDSEFCSQTWVKFHIIAWRDFFLVIDLSQFNPLMLQKEAANTIIIKLLPYAAVIHFLKYPANLRNLTVKLAYHSEHMVPMYCSVFKNIQK